MKIAILFPNNESSRYIGAKLLETRNDVAFYCPDKVHLEIAQDMIFELNILGKEQNQLRGQENSFSGCQGNNLADCEIIGRFMLII